MAAVQVQNAKDSEVHITYADQKQINKFARYNARLQDIKEELEAKKSELQNLEDAQDELLMVEDETARMPFKVGEVFVMHSQDDTSKMLEETKEQLLGKIDELESTCNSHRLVLSELKIQLYAKFGNNINLEADEE